MYWAIGVIVLLIIGFILDREIYFYEGVHLGPRFQAWFYDQWATKYDAGKRESQLRDDEMLAQPLMEKLADVPEPFVLDFATGTGRLSFALLNRPEFAGHIIALDISQKMLEQAAEKIAGRVGGVPTAVHLHRPQVPVSRPLNMGAPRHRTAGTVSSTASTSTQPPLPKGYDVSARVEFLRQPTLPLPFPDAAFDVVCCLEVLELLPDAQAALNEMSRLLRPGGVLLTSRGTEESGRKAKVKSAEEFTVMLQQSGFENVQITKWWKVFDRVFAVKQGKSDAVGAKRLTEVLKCAVCGNISWTASQGSLRCSQCGKMLTITNEGIVLN
jgi:SAM-dependent methyltransferase